MDSLFTGVCCILSFLCGIWVMKDCPIPKRLQYKNYLKEVDGAEGGEDKLAQQWVNVLSYNGKPRKKVIDDEE